MTAALVVAAALALQSVPSRVVSEVRVHGNHSTPDAQVLAIARVHPGDVAGAGTARDIESRLRASGRFRRVEVLERSRTLDGRDLALVIIVEERAVAVTETAAGVVLHPARRLAARPMFLPILDFSDYGFSYGLRATLAEPVGDGSRLSMPFTWGARKRVAFEYGHAFGDRRLQITASAAWQRQTNPFHQIDDSRRGADTSVSYAPARSLRLRARGGITDVMFGDAGDRFPWVAADVTVDTRIDPDLPREAVYASVGWERLAFGRYARASRVRTDLRAYLGLVGQSVLAVRALHAMSTVPLPPFERVVLGGPSTLRGHPFGFAEGDNLAVGSMELRLPMLSPLSRARTGVYVFTDVGAAYDRGISIDQADFKWGYGAGLFVGVTVLKLNLEVASDGHGRVRAHLASGFGF